MAQGSTTIRENQVQINGNAVDTGAGTGGSGTQRVILDSASALAANQSSNVNQWGGSNTTLGQKAMASSVPVVLASDQASIPVTLTSTTITGTVTVAGGKTNNNAAPGATNVGALVGIATAAVQTWTEGNEVLLSTDLSGRLRSDVTSWLGSTAPTVGSKTSANSVPVVIASDQGAVAVTLTSTTITGTVTVAGGKTDNNAAPGATNIGALVAVANAAQPTRTEGNEVLLSTNLRGAVRGIIQDAALNDRGMNVTASNAGLVDVSASAANATAGLISVKFDQTTQGTTNAVSGAKTNNNAVPGATNIGALVSLANAAKPTWTEGNLTTLSSDLAGNTRIRLNDAAGNDRGANVDASNRLTIDNSSWIGSTAPTVGSKTSANSIPVVIASDQGAVTVAGNKTNNNAAPGATNVGTLPALATAAVQTWTEGNQVALSTDLSGRVRIDNTSWLGSTAPTVGSKTSANSVPVVIASDQAAVAITETDITGSGTISTQNLNPFSGTATTNSTVALTTSNGISTVAIQITGNYGGTLYVQAQLDSTNWVNLIGITKPTTGATSSFIPAGAVGLWQIDCAGFLQVRVTALTGVTGSATVTLRGSNAISEVTIDNLVSLNPTSLGTIDPLNSVQQQMLVADKPVKNLLESILLELQAFNANAGVSATDVNQYKTLDAGKQVVSSANTRGRIRTANLTLSATTTETTLIPAVPGEVHDLLAIWMINTSAATNTRVDIRDSTGGLTIYPFQPTPVGPPVGISLGGVAIPQSGVNQNWTAQCGTSTTDVRITAVYSVNNL